MPACFLRALTAGAGGGLWTRTFLSCLVLAGPSLPADGLWAKLYCHCFQFVEKLSSPLYVEHSPAALCGRQQSRKRPK